jgi:DHA2 family multidrug resistance protein
MLARRQQFHQARLVETLDPLNPNYTLGLGRVSRGLVGHGQSVVAAPREALAQLYGAVQTQAAMLSYIDVFYLLMVVVFACIPLLLFMRGQSSSGGGGGAP